MPYVHIRPAGPSDKPFLLAMLVEAADWSGRGSPTAADVQDDPALAHYIDGWPRPSDFGVIATNDAGDLTGAAWARQFDANDPAYGFVDNDIPEIGMGVVAAFRGQGVGTRLLAALIHEARDRNCRALSLSVEDANRAARALYERAGFKRLGRNGKSDTMTLDITGTVGQELSR